ncbi:nucleotidyltransferase family protein [Vibrio kanaloae]|uniref:Nucleotidyltransferase family protein n=1 Tax=Vibrio kanaloae TaxID=170673 RepID=A0A4U1YPU8_9VIBR|nr:nucleotidyltransferase family protein [Vibrio kanaloae]TKF23173.1 nucleotidyltransferase family protein [Vibrio kanaloae]
MKFRKNTFLSMVYDLVLDRNYIELERLLECEFKTEDQKVNFLRKEKILYGYLSYFRDSLSQELSNLLKAYDEISAHKLKIDSYLEEMNLVGKVMYVKGPNYSYLYPKGMIREVRDLDLLFDSKTDYIKFVSLILAKSYRNSKLWLMKQNKIETLSGIFQHDMSHPFPWKYSDKLWLEVHYKNYPGTFYSGVNLIEVFATKPFQVSMMIAFMVEIINRDNKAKSFSIRDAIDFNYLLESLTDQELLTISRFVCKESLHFSLLLINKYLTDQNIYLRHEKKLAFLLQEIKTHSSFISEHQDIVENNKYDCELHHAIDYVKCQGLNDQIIYNDILRRRKENENYNLTIKEVKKHHDIGIPLEGVITEKISCDIYLADKWTLT